jgi:hypothetical protein
MRKTLAAAVLGGGMTAVAAGVMFAAPGGQSQDRPGQIGQAKVWIENRGRAEAVPIILQEVMTPTPIGVQVTGTPTVALAPASVVQARVARQQWEYRTVDLEREQDPAAALSRAGAEGWEATGIQLLNRAGAPVVMKRPK